MLSDFYAKSLRFAYKRIAIVGTLVSLFPHLIKTWGLFIIIKTELVISCDMSKGIDSVWFTLFLRYPIILYCVLSTRVKISRTNLVTNAFPVSCLQETM